MTLDLRVEQGFREFFKDDEQFGKVTIRPVLCAVGVPDFTGVEDILRMTVGQQSASLLTWVPTCRLIVTNSANFLLSPILDNFWFADNPGTGRLLLIKRVFHHKFSIKHRAFR
jgi:hypothetical protein